MSGCAKCGLSIEGRAPNAIYCGRCAREREAKLRSNRNIYQTLALTYVHAAIRHGDLPKLDGSIACVDCGAPAAEYEHRDYKQPLAVEPVCRCCNAKRGPGLNKDPRDGKAPRLTLLKRFRAKQEAA